VHDVRDRGGEVALVGVDVACERRLVNVGGVGLVEQIV